MILKVLICDFKQTPFLFLCFPLTAIPEFPKKPPLLSFWNKCTSHSSGIYHTSAEKLIKQLDLTFGAAVNEQYPGLAETGAVLECVFALVTHGAALWWGGS